MMGFTLDLQRLLTWRPGKLAKGTLAMTAGMGLRTVGQAVVFLIVARVLGVEAYGAYSAVLALAMTLGGFGGLGVTVIMLRDTARDSAVFTESWGRTLAALILTVPALLIIYFLLAFWILPEQVDGVVIACLGLAEILFAPLTLSAVQAYQGHERIGRAAHMVLAPILARLTAALLLPLALLLPDAACLPVWSLAYLLAAAASTAYALWLLRHDFGLGLAPHWRGLERAVREGWPFSVSGVANKVYVDIDKIMLARLATLEATGAYSAAYRVVDMAMVPIVSFLAAATPRFFRSGTGGSRASLLYALRLLPLPMLYALGVGSGIYLLAGLLSWLLGPSFTPAVETLRWLVALPLLTMIRRFWQLAYFGYDRQRAVMIVLMFGASINIILNLWLIPVMDWRGAVLATYTAELGMVLLFATALARKGEGWRHISLKKKEKKINHQI